LEAISRSINPSFFRLCREPLDHPNPNHIKKGRGAIFLCAECTPWREFASLAKQQRNRKIQTKGKPMKKLLLLPLVAIGLALVPVKQADAQVSIGIGGVGVGFGYPAYRYGYYGYPGYYGYYPRSYYSYYGGYPYYRSSYYTGRPYYYSGHRHKHHKHYYYRY
jgi:hypothetical protein